MCRKCITGRDQRLCKEFATIVIIIYYYIIIIIIAIVLEGWK